MADQEIALPDPATAYQNLFDGVHQRVFFHKLAQFGYMPRTEKQAAEYLNLAGKLRLIDEEQAVKEAEESLDPISAANAALDRTLHEVGFTSVKTAAENEERLSIKHAAAQWAEDPDIYNSVLALKAHEAQQFLDVGQS